MSWLRTADPQSDPILWSGMQKLADATRLGQEDRYSVAAPTDAFQCLFSTPFFRSTTALGFVNGVEQDGDLEGVDADGYDCFRFTNAPGVAGRVSFSADGILLRELVDGEAWARRQLVGVFAACGIPAPAADLLAYPDDGIGYLRGLAWDMTAFRIVSPLKRGDLGAFPDVCFAYCEIAGGTDTRKIAHRGLVARVKAGEFDLGAALGLESQANDFAPYAVSEKPVFMSRH